MLMDCDVSEERAAIGQPTLLAPYLLILPTGLRSPSIRQPALSPRHGSNRRLTPVLTRVWSTLGCRPIVLNGQKLCPARGSSWTISVAVSVPFFPLCTLWWRKLCQPTSNVTDRGGCILYIGSVLYQQYFNRFPRVMCDCGQWVAPSTFPNTFRKKKANRVGRPINDPWGRNDRVEVS